MSRTTAMEETMSTYDRDIAHAIIDYDGPRTGWEDIREKFSDRYVGEGTSRIVFQVDDSHVIKVGATYANKLEVEKWEGATEELKDVLCPMVDYDKSHKWIVMKKADELPSKNEAIDVKLKVEERIGRKIKDLHAGNVAELDGKPVIVDYEL